MYLASRHQVRASASFDPDDHLDIDAVKVASSSTWAFSSVMWGHLRRPSLQASWRMNYIGCIHMALRLWHFCVNDVKR